MKKTNEKAVKVEGKKKENKLNVFVNLSLKAGIQPSQSLRVNAEGKSKVTEPQLLEASAILEDVIKAHKFTKDNIIDYCEKQVGKVDVNYKDLPLNKQRALPSLCASVKKGSTCTMKQVIKAVGCIDNLVPNLKLGIKEDVIRIAYLAVYSNPKLEAFEAQLSVAKGIK